MATVKVSCLTNQGTAARPDQAATAARSTSPMAARSLGGTSTLKRAEIKGGMIETMNEIVVEVQGQEKPALVAESLGRLVF